MSAGLQKLNKDAVQKGTMRFILSFIVVSALSFLTVFLFFKSAELQNRQIKRDRDDYLRLISKNELIKVQLDTIYKRMSILGTGKSPNEFLLTKTINKNIVETKAIMQQDSVKGFAHYNTLLSQIDDIMNFKRKLTKATGEESAALRDLTICTGNETEVSSRLNKPGPATAIPQPKLSPLGVPIEE